ncbi:hypothetical protein, unlikely [Trypanosoma brucei gambiense DAL972]|uniref:Uncharacterized protein n=1 Tax=Trypanosoma brucei gambiense (strain MHOM/CI/86/DAL972) TaxID=679716 RepID=C9ZK48_TRYB9|nr:hypothetical protein, unlikely [Trypanosoma brucei gambiense DAL972]CBH09812.1 hypothetical protein, unlikely [Trypanosoma brucei gambiense DAL972]|eukprot:XP_011772105.1 hypothetical protein, unlikely [Trypanosoma brucei gambiense DAL972]
MCARVGEREMKKNKKEDEGSVESVHSYVCTVRMQTRATQKETGRGGYVHFTYNLLFNLLIRNIRIYIRTCTCKRFLYRVGMFCVMFLSCCCCLQSHAEKKKTT